MARLRETMLMLSRFKGLPQFEWMEWLLTNLEDKFHLHGLSQVAQLKYILLCHCLLVLLN